MIIILNSYTYLNSKYVKRLKKEFFEKSIKTIDFSNINKVTGMPLFDDGYLLLVTRDNEKCLDYVCSSLEYMSKHTILFIVKSLDDSISLQRKCNSVGLPFKYVTDNTDYLESLVQEVNIMLPELTKEQTDLLIKKSGRNLYSLKKNILSVQVNGIKEIKHCRVWEHPSLIVDILSNLRKVSKYSNKTKDVLKIFNDYLCGNNLDFFTSALIKRCEEIITELTLIREGSDVPKKLFLRRTMLKSKDFDINSVLKILNFSSEKRSKIEFFNFFLEITENERTEKT